MIFSLVREDKEEYKDNFFLSQYTSKLSLCIYYYDRNLWDEKYIHMYIRKNPIVNPVQVRVTR